MYTIYEIQLKPSGAEKSNKEVGNKLANTSQKKAELYISKII